MISGANLQFELPPGRWRDLPLPKGKTVDGLLIAHDSGVAVVVVGERIGVEVELSRDAMVSAAQSLLRLQTPNMQFENERPLTACGLDGIRFEARGEKLGLPAYSVMWVARQNGFLYMVASAGLAEDSAKIVEMHRQVLCQMSLVDPQRVVHTVEGDLVQTFESTDFRYRVDLQGLGWLWLDKSETTVNQFKAVRANLVLSVTPVAMPGRKVDEELLAKACLGQAGIEYPSPDVHKVGPCQMGAIVGTQYEVRRETDRGTLDCVIRLAANEQAVYMVRGIAVEADEESVNFLRQSMDRIAVIPGPVTHPTPASAKDVDSEAKLLNEFGLILFRRGDLAGALDFVGAAYKALPSDTTLLSNYVDVLVELGRMTEALQVLDRHLEVYRGNQEVMAARARLIAKNGEPEKARRLYSELFYDGCTNEETLAEYLTLAEQAEAYDEAIATVEQFALRRPTVAVQMELAGLYSAKGDHKTALGKLKQLRDQNPHSLDVAVSMAIACSRAERHDEALEITQQWLDSGQRSEIVLLLHGKHQLKAERFAEAKQTFEKAVEQFPTSDVAKEMLALAVGQLGQGDNSAILTPIAPVEISQTVRAAIAKVSIQPTNAMERYGAEEQVRIVGVHFQPNEPRRTTVSRRIKVHTPGGVTKYSALTFELNPLAERFYVNRLVVLDAAGRQVAQGAAETYYVRDDTSSGMATNAKTVTVPVPGLKPGYSIECMVTREDRAASKTFGFDESVLSSDVPVGVSVYYITGQTQGLKHKASLSLQVAADEKLLYCITTNPTPNCSESRQVAAEKFLPIVWVADAGATWEAETRDYLEMIQDKLVLDDETRQLAAELTRNCQSNREKLAVLAGYAQQACTYHAIEFGRRGKVPNTAAQTLSLKYGDCKDHAVLLQQLLRGAGIPSHLTVVNSADQIQPELVSLDQFDHMVLFVPGDAVAQPQNETGGLIIDLTQKNSDPLLYPCLGLAKKSMLVLDPAAPRLVHLPALPLDALQLTCQRRVVLQPNATAPSIVDAHVQERLSFNTFLAAGMRGYLRSHEVGERRTAIQQILSTSQSARLRKIEVENLDELSKPLVVYLEYTLPDAIHSLAASELGSALVGRIPAPWETFFLEAEYVEKRETPFEIGSPKLIRSNVEIVLPKGFQIAEVERLDGTGRTPFAAWASKARVDGSSVHLEHVVRVPAGSFRAQDYPAYYAGMKQSLSALQSPFTFSQRVSVAETGSPALLR